jgi:aminomethyltransferase
MTAILSRSRTNRSAWSHQRPSPFLKKNIGLAYVPAEHAPVGTELFVVIRGRNVPARVVETPFYKRARKYD